MARISAVPAAQDGLKAALETQAALPANPLAGVLYGLGEPAEIRGEQAVWVREEPERQPEQRFDSTGIGAQRKYEEFTLRVGCFAARTGDDYTGVRDLAMDLAAEVELAVLADEDLGGGVFLAMVSGTRIESGALAGKRGMIVDVLVRCQAYNA